IVTFDTQRGLAEKIVSQSRSSKGNGEEEVVKLDEIKTHDADWVRRFSADAERYFPAQQAYQKVKEKRLKALIDGKHMTAADRKAALDKAVANLKATRAELKLPVFQEGVDEIISRNDFIAKLVIEDYERYFEILNKPAAEWSTTD